MEKSGKIIGSLLWMDDVVLMAETAEDLQEMLNITKKVADKYHIVFGEEKSKTMTINQKKNENQMIYKMGEMVVKNTDWYKYLGEIINKKMNAKDQIEEIKKKVEAAYQTISTIAGDVLSKGIQM